MSVGSLRAEVHDTPFSLSRWKEALAGGQLLPHQEWGSWKGIIPPNCQDWGWSSLPSKNVTDGKFKFKRRLDFKATGSYSVKAKFYRESFFLSPLFSSPHPQGLSRPEKEHTVLNCFPNWEKERQKTRLWTHSRTQGGSKKCISLGALVTCIASNMVTSGCLGWAWALCPALSILSQEKRPLPRCWL